MPVVEFATFQLSEAFLADPDLDLEALDIFKQSEGFLGAWTGRDIEDKKKAYVIVVWDTLESHKRLPSSPLYPKLAEKVRPTLGGPLTIINVEFDKDHTVAFNAPVTEILIHRLKKGKTAEDLNAAVAQLAAHYASAGGIRHPQAHGPVLESPGTFHTVIGWDSHEVRKAVATAESTAVQVAKLLAIAEVKVVKVEFQKRACSTAGRNVHGPGLEQNSLYRQRSSDCSHL